VSLRRGFVLSTETSSAYWPNSGARVINSAAAVIVRSGLTGFLAPQLAGTRSSANNPNAMRSGKYSNSSCLTLEKQAAFKNPLFPTMAETRRFRKLGAEPALGE
jgi:hypothetical protein